MRRWVHILGLIFVLVLLAACQPEAPLPTFVPIDTATPEPSPAPTNTPSLTPPPSPTATPTVPQVVGRFASDPTKSGFLRVIHAAPDTGAVDIYVDVSNLANNVEFKLATGRTNVLAGEYNVRITERGVSPDERVLAQAPLSLRVGQSVIMVFAGVSNALNISTYEESTEPLDAGVSRVNFIHAVPLAPMVKAQQNSIDVSPLFDFGQQSGPILVSAGQTALSFASSEQTFATYQANLFPRANYTLVLVGRSDALDQLSVLVFDNQAPARITLRVINASPSLGAVDAYLDGGRLVENIGYRSASERVTQTDGTHILSIYPAGADPNTTEPLLADVSFNTIADDTLSLIVMGSAGNVRTLIFKEDLSPVLADRSRIAFINAREDTPIVSVHDTSGYRADVGNLHYGQASAYTEIAVGTDHIYWHEEGGDEALLQEVTNFVTDAGRSSLYILTEGSESFVLGETVEINAEVVVLPTAASDFVPTEIPPRIRVRGINVLYDQLPVDFIANNEEVALNLTYGQTSEFLDVGELAVIPISIRQTGAVTPLITQDVRMFDISAYTLFFYGSANDIIILPISDAGMIFDGATTTYRLVNLATDEGLTLGLVSTEPTDPSLPATGSQFTIPLGSTFIVNATRSGTHSFQAPAFYGLRDLVVVDTRSNTEVYRIRSYNFEQGAHYDVVVTQLPAQFITLRVDVIKYPRN